MLGRIRTALAIAILAASLPARAGVTLLQDGSDPAVPAQILVQGEIRKGDFAAFRNAADRVAEVAVARVNGVPFVTVLLRSQGGNVIEALRIGQLLHERMMLTLVRPREECSSACVFILIAGAVHTPTGARIGVHRPEFAPASRARLTDTQARQFYDALSDDLRRYFVRMGVHDGAWQLMMGTRGQLHYFSPGELELLRLRGAHGDWEAQYRTRWDEEQQALSVEAVPRADLLPVARPARLQAPLFSEAALRRYDELFVMPGGELTQLQQLGPRTIRFTIGAPSPPKPPAPTVEDLLRHMTRLADAVAADAGRHLWLLLVLFELWRNRPARATPSGSPLRWRRGFLMPAGTVLPRR